MDKNKTKKLGGATVISGLCCFGLINFLLGLFGLTAALAYVNQYGDYIFLPAFAIFGVLLNHALLKSKNKWIKYSISIITTGIIIYFAIFAPILIILGIIIALAIIKWKK